MGSWCPCGDFRWLDLLTEPDIYLLPNMLGLCCQVGQGHCFSKIDLRKGPAGHLDRALRDCHTAFAWINDIVICSRNHEEHIVHMQQVLQALQDIGIISHD
jgi:hypothetical protein